MLLDDDILVGIFWKGNFLIHFCCLKVIPLTLFCVLLWPT